jgi:hypothetical protein
MSFRRIVFIEASPGWISLRLLTWSAAALSGTAAVITWLHATGCRPRSIRGRCRPIVYASRHLPATTLAFLLLGFAQIAARPRGRATVAILFTIVTVASIVVPIGLRAGSVRPRPNLTPRSSIDPGVCQVIASSCSVSMVPHST